jgi:hypothetical protein
MSDKSKELRGISKRRRNRVYRTCGVIMLLAILVVLANFLKLIPDKVFSTYHLTFWMETIAVESFGFSWLVKAGVFLKDFTTEDHQPALNPQQQPMSLTTSNA